MKSSYVGLLAYSKCGRDRKRLFAVVGAIGDGLVLVADGRLRKIEKPKKKKLKHLSFIGVQTALPSTNGELYRCISEYDIEARRDYSAEG